jgi:Ankyrin repeats (many copies)
MVDSDLALRHLVAAIVSEDAARCSQLLVTSPELAKACFRTGATRATAKAHYLDQIGRYIVAGDTALHIAAASYQTQRVQTLINRGADVHARNRFGDQPLHAAAVGLPGSPMWNPPAQAATILFLIEAGADPNAVDKRGVSPLHRAVRTRCATAVRTLLECGADPMRRNKNGSNPMLLAVKSTGRGGTGSPEAKAQQEEIVRLLRQNFSGPPFRNSGVSESTK